MQRRSWKKRWRVCCNNNSLFVLFYKCRSSRHSIYCGAEECRLLARRCQHHGVLPHLTAWQHSRCWEGGDSGGDARTGGHMHAYACTLTRTDTMAGCYWRMRHQPVSNRGPLSSQTPPPLVKPERNSLKYKSSWTAPIIRQINGRAWNLQFTLTKVTSWGRGDRACSGLRQAGLNAGIIWCSCQFAAHALTGTNPTLQRTFEEVLWVKRASPARGRATRFYECALYIHINLLKRWQHMHVWMCF